MYKNSSSCNAVAKSKWSHLRKSSQSETDLKMNKLQSKAIVIISNLS